MQQLVVLASKLGHEITAIEEDMNKFWTLLCLSLLCVIPASLFATDGKALYHEKTCVTCHGEDGKSKSPQYPYLAGQNQQYLINQFKSITEGRRTLGSAAMMAKHPSLKGFTEKQILAVTGYLASLPRPAEAISTNSKLIAQGKSIFRSIGCKQCHGEEGKGMPPGSPKKYEAYPKLNGQHATYIYNQLQSILSHKRTNDNTKIMQKQLAKAKLSDHDLKALAAYLSQVH